MLLAFTTLSAQVITAKEMMEKLNCPNDSACINTFLLSKGFIAIPRPEGLISNRYEYISTKPVCQQAKDSMTYNYLQLYMYGKNNLLDLSTFCNDIYTNLLKDYKALGFSAYKQVANQYNYKSSIYPQYRLLTEIKKRKDGTILYTIEVKTLANK